MRQNVLILLGVLMITTMLGLLFFAGAIYDSEQKHTIETFFFEPNPKSDQRVSQPISVDSMPDSFLREAIIKRFVNEYFYVIPDVNNAQQRMEFKNTDGTKNALRGLSRNHPIISENWLKNTAPEILDLAHKRALRLVSVTDISESESGHLIVRYELKTWKKPNDILAEPEITVGDLYIDVTKAPIRIEQTDEALQRLLRGTDPVSAFTFGILEVVKD